MDTAAAGNHHCRTPEETAAVAVRPASIHPEALVGVAVGHMPAESTAENTRLVGMEADHIPEEGCHYSRDCERVEGVGDVAVRHS